MSKRGIVANILAQKCPKCREGDLYNSGIYRGKLYDMPERCKNCGQKFDLEPGFYWGAMYVSYMIASFILLVTSGVCLLVLKISLPIFWPTIIIVAILSIPLISRLSRSIWIHIFVSYDPNFKISK